MKQFEKLKGVEKNEKEVQFKILSNVYEKNKMMLSFRKRLKITRGRCISTKLSLKMEICSTSIL